MFLVSTGSENVVLFNYPTHFYEHFIAYSHTTESRGK